MNQPDSPTKERLTFPSVCHACHAEIGPGDKWVGIFRQGSAWQTNAAGELWAPLYPDTKIVLYTAEAYHEACDPSV